jgi:hypothetical protein
MTLSVKNSRAFQADKKYFESIIASCARDEDKREVQVMYKKFLDTVKKLDESVDDLSHASLNYQFHIGIRAELKKIKTQLDTKIKEMSNTSQKK